MALVTNAAQRIEIVVRKDIGIGGDSNDTDTSPKEKQEENSATNTETKGLTRLQKRVRTSLNMHAIAAANQVVTQTANYIVGGIGVYSGDSTLQDYAQRQVEKFTDTTGVLSSISMGAVSGFMVSGGNIGVAAISAGISAVSTLTSKYYKYAARHREYEFKNFKENNAIEYNRSRANINLTTGRLR